MIPLDLRGVAPDVLDDLDDLATVALEFDPVFVPPVPGDDVFALDVWVTTINGSGLVVLSGKGRLPSGRESAFLDKAVFVDSDDMVVRTSLWWVRLGSHLLEVDPGRVRSILVAAAARCDELRAAVLERASG